LHTLNIFQLLIKKKFYQVTKFYFKHIGIYVKDKIYFSPPFETVAVRKPSVGFLCRGFLLPCNPSLGMKLIGLGPPPIEVGESSRGGDSEEVVGFRQCLMLHVPSSWGDFF
jgi:hypothetical protein